MKKGEDMTEQKKMRNWLITLEASGTIHKEREFAVINGKFMPWEEARRLLSQVYKCDEHNQVIEVSVMKKVVLDYSRIDRGDLNYDTWCDYMVRLYELIFNSAVPDLEVSTKKIEECEFVIQKGKVYLWITPNSEHNEPETNVIKILNTKVGNRRIGPGVFADGLNWRDFISYADLGILPNQDEAVGVLIEFKNAESLVINNIP